MAVAIKKGKPVESLAELRYKLYEKFAEYESGVLTDGQINSYAKVAGVIVNTYKVEIIGAQLSGQSHLIDGILGNESQKKVSR